MLIVSLIVLLLLRKRGGGLGGGEFDVRAPCGQDQFFGEGGFGHYVGGRVRIGLKEVAGNRQAPGYVPHPLPVLGVQQKPESPFVGLRESLIQEPTRCYVRWLRDTAYSP